MYWDLIGEVGTYDEEHAPILIFYYIDYIYIYKYKIYILI